MHSTYVNRKSNVTYNVLWVFVVSARHFCISTPHNAKPGYLVIILFRLHLRASHSAVNLISNLREGILLTCRKSERMRKNDWIFPHTVELVTKKFITREWKQTIKRVLRRCKAQKFYQYFMYSGFFSSFWILSRVYSRDGLN